MSEQAPGLPKADLWAAALALASVALGLASFVWARRHPEFPWDGPLLLLAAGGALLAAVRRLPGGASERAAPQAGWGWPSLARVSRWRLALGAASAGLTLLLLQRLADPAQSAFGDEVALWLAAIVAFVVAVAPPVSRPREDWGLWWEVNRGVVVAVGAIVLAALALRVWNLEGIPANLGGDEGSQGVEALRVLRGELRNPFGTGWLGVPTMSFFWNSLSIRILGPTIAALRLPWALVGTLTVLTTFWLVARLRGLTLGLVTAALLAAYHFHIHFSRLGSNQIADPFFVSAALIFLYRARDRHSPLDWALVGIAMGVAQYFYAGARLTLVVVGLCVLHFFWVDRSRRDTLRDLVGGALTLAGSFVVTAAPMLQYALRFPNDYNARLNEVGIIQSGWLAREPAIRGVSTLQVLWDQFLRAALSFNVYPDRTVWYGSPEPLMDSVWGALFLLGLLYATLRLVLPQSDSRLFPLAAWWWSGMILGGMLTESPPSSQRLIVLAPPAVFFVGLMLLRLAQALQGLFNTRDLRTLAPGLALAVALLAATSLRWYFGPYREMNVYGSRNAEIATVMATQLPATMEPDQTVVFLGPPFIYLGFGTIPYLAPEVAQGIDIHEPLVAPPTAASLGLPSGQRPLFVVLEPRAAELELAAQGFPGGARREVSNAAGKLLFWVYEP